MSGDWLIVSRPAILATIIISSYGKCAPAFPPGLQHTQWSARELFMTAETRNSMILVDSCSLATGNRCPVSRGSTGRVI